MIVAFKSIIVGPVIVCLAPGGCVNLILLASP